MFQMEERSYPSQLNIIMLLYLASMTSIKWLGFILLWYHAEDGLFKSSTTSSGLAAVNVVIVYHEVTGLDDQQS